MSFSFRSRLFQTQFVGQKIFFEILKYLFLYNQSQVYYYKAVPKNMPILHMLLLISRTAFHKNSFGRLLLILFNIFFIVMESTLYMRYFFMFYLFVLRMNFWTFHQKDYWKQTLLLLYFLIYITKATNKRHASEKGEELLRKKQVSNKWFFFVIESYLELFTNNSF